MSPWMKYPIEMEHYHTLLREAEQRRLARQALAGRQMHPLALGCAMRWLGARLTTWGKQLQERYSTAVAAASLTAKHSD
jgi:hypothetical protein